MHACVALLGMWGAAQSALDKSFVDHAKYESMSQALARLKRNGHLVGIAEDRFRNDTPTVREAGEVVDSVLTYSERSAHWERHYFDLSRLAPVSSPMATYLRSSQIAGGAYLQEAIPNLRILVRDAPNVVNKTKWRDSLRYLEDTARLLKRGHGYGPPTRPNVKLKVPSLESFASELDRFLVLQRYLGSNPRASDDDAWRARSQLQNLYTISLEIQFADPRANTVRKVAWLRVPLTGSRGRPFSDVPERHWAAGAIRELRSVGLLSGYSGANGSSSFLARPDFPHPNLSPADGRGASD